MKNIRDTKSFVKKDLQNSYFDVELINIKEVLNLNNYIVPILTTGVIVLISNLIKYFVSKHYKEKSIENYYLFNLMVMFPKNTMRVIIGLSLFYFIITYINEQQFVFEMAIIYGALTSLLSIEFVSWEMLLKFLKQKR